MDWLKKAKHQLVLVLLGVGLLTRPAFSQPYAFSTLAGVGCGSADGTNSSARFFYPKGGAMDSAGNLYFADSGNHTIRKITPAGVSSTLAGLAGSAGSANGTGSAARFFDPSGVAVDANGNVYVADTGNHTIRMITPAGVVSTLAGKAGNYGAVDGTNNAARFYHPMCLTLDSGGNIYVADTYNQLIRKIRQDPRTGGWVVSTLAGTAGVPGAVDGSSALFHNPWDLAVDGLGNVYVADACNSTIRMITSLGVTSTLAGVAGLPGTNDGAGTNARFSNPVALTIDGGGNLYVADGATSVIRTIAQGGIVHTIAGQPGILGNADGPGAAALFNDPSGLVVDSAGANLYVADTGNNTIRQITAGPLVTTFAGLPAASCGTNDGTNATARFLGPLAVAVDPAGNLYAADTGNNTIRKITPAGVVTTLAGQPGVSGTNDGTNATALFWRPAGIAVDSSTNLYVADNNNHTIRKVTPSGVVTTIAGTAGVSGYFDGTNGTARFLNPSGLAVDAGTNLYVADFGNSLIRKITPLGIVSTFAGNPGSNGSIDGTNLTAEFLMPSALALDNSNNLYVADTGNQTIRLVTPAGVVTTLAGLAGNPGSSDGTNNRARFNFPHGIAVDAASNLYVADTFNLTIRKIAPGGGVTTVAGLPQNSGVADDAGPGAQFIYPFGLAVDGASNLYVADAFNNSIRKGVINNQPIVTADLLNQSSLGGNTVIFTASAEGGGSLQYQWQANGVNISGATNSTLVLNPVTTNNAVTYDYVVTSAYGSVTSQVASLTVSVPPNDAFANAAILSGTNASLISSNIGATKEPGEPYHAGNIGGRSVWWSWTAPANGTMTLDTSGSSYDTLLAVYTGNSVSSLTPLISNDDYTNLTSRVVFGAKAGKTYRIAVDGYNNGVNGGASGIVHLNLAWAPPQFPAITASPQPQFDIPGASVAFSASAVGSPPLNFQWRSNGVSIPGATNSTLAIFYVTASNAATFDLVASDEFTNAITSPATLTIGTGATFRTLAGTSGYGGADGTGGTARFHDPVDVVADAAGNLYIADLDNDTIRKVTPGGVATTLAGLAGVSGSADGTNSGARFSTPAGVTLDVSGNLYVADAGNNTIRKVTPAGVVTTLAGLPGAAGRSDGTGTAARFSSPAGIATDPFGNIYVADSGNHTIRFVTPAGAVTTIAGKAGTAGFADGPLTNALFNFPQCIRFDAFSNLYVADTLNDAIRKISPAGIVSTCGGISGVPGSLDGPSTNSLFDDPEGLCLDALGNVFVTDSGNDTVREITVTSNVLTIAGLAGVPGFADGVSNNAMFNHPTGIAPGAFGDLFVTDNNNNEIRKIAPGGVVTTLAGTIGYGSADGTGPAARFNFPTGLAVDAHGNAFVSDYLNATIREITPMEAVTTLAGSVGNSGSADGTNGNAQFGSPTGVAIDPAGNLYVADTANETIRKVTPAGVVTTLAGTAGIVGSADGVGTAARFNSPFGVALDAATNLFVSDTGNYTIREINPTGKVTTFAGTPNGRGYLDAVGTNAFFAGPTGIAVDGAGNVYVSDSPNSIIRKITSAGVVTTLAGSPGISGFVDGTGRAAEFADPDGLALDASTNVLVVDQANNTIRSVSPQGMVSTLAGAPGFRGFTDGVGTAALFSAPEFIATDASGYLYVSDSGNYTLRTTSPGPPALQLLVTQNSVVLFWPANATNYTVQTASAIPPNGNWSPNTNFPVFLAGTNFVQTNPLGAPVFYRLVRQQ